VDRILIVDDDETAREALAALLAQEGYTVATARNGIEAAASIDHDPPDLVISDVRMPGATGFDLVKYIRSRPIRPDTPVILVSAMGETPRRIAGLDLGADDYLVKPVDTAELLAHVRVQLRHVRRHEALERRAVLDPLTGILNRRGLLSVLRRQQERARRDGTPLSVLMVDVDRFKALNDSYGHQAGDTVLRHIARALVGAMRIEDHVGRLGGDEFLVILPEDEGSATALAERLSHLRVPPLAVGNGQDLEVTVSVGAATMRPGESLDHMIDRADAEMYRRKRVRAATPPPTQH